LVCKIDDLDFLIGVSPSSRIDERWMVPLFSWKKKRDVKKKGEPGGGSGIRIADEKRYVCVCMRACAFYIRVDGDYRNFYPG
jgi:hypothetical protein